MEGISRAALRNYGRYLEGIHRGQGRSGTAGRWSRTANCGGRSSSTTLSHQCGQPCRDWILDAGSYMLRSKAGGAFEPETIALLARFLRTSSGHCNCTQRPRRREWRARFCAMRLRRSPRDRFRVDGRGEVLNLTQAAKLILDWRDELLLELQHIVAQDAAKQFHLVELCQARHRLGREVCASNSLLD